MSLVRLPHIMLMLSKVYLQQASTLLYNQPLMQHKLSLLSLHWENSTEIYHFKICIKILNKIYSKVNTSSFPIFKVNTFSVIDTFFLGSHWGILTVTMDWLWYIYPVLKIISKCEVNYMMNYPIKIITLVLNV